MMKLKNLLTPVLALLATSLTLGAQTGVETGTPFGSGDDSIQCRQNISLFTSYVKGNNFKEAYPFWLGGSREVSCFDKEHLPLRSADYELEDRDRRR